MATDEVPVEVVLVLLESSSSDISSLTRVNYLPLLLLVVMLITMPMSRPMSHHERGLALNRLPRISE